MKDRSIEICAKLELGYWEAYDFQMTSVVLQNCVHQSEPWQWVVLRMQSNFKHCLSFCKIV